MAFKAGSIYGEAVLDTKKWDGGIKRITKGAAIAVAAIGAAFVAGMTKAIVKANEFQKAMSNVATVIDTSEISTKALTKELLRLDPALGDTTELTNGLYQAFSAGAKDAKEAMDITVSAAKFGKAALTDTNTAVDVLTTAINAYGRESMNAEKAADIFFTTIKEGKITGEELTGTIGQSISLFASAGIELDELTSAMAAMTKVGVSANETTSQLNGIVNAFLGPSEAMASRLKDIGYESGSAFLEAEGLTGALKFMEDATKGDAAEIKKLTPNMRAMRGIMALTGEGGEAFTAILKEMEGASGAANEAFQKQEKTFDTYLVSVGKIETVIGNIGKAFIDEIAEGATVANENMLEFITSAQAMEIMADVAGVVAGAFEMIKIAMEVIGEKVGPVVKELWNTLTEALGPLFEKTSSSGIAMKIFAGAVNIASASIKVAISFVQMYIDRIINLVEVLRLSGDVISKAVSFQFGEAKEAAIELGDAIVNMGRDWFSGYETLVKESIDLFKGFFLEAGGDAEDYTARVKIAVDAAGGYVRKNFDSWITGQEEVEAAVEKSNKNIETSTSKTWASVEKTITDSVKSIKNALQGMMDEFWSYLHSLASGIVDAMSQITSSIADIFSMHYDNQLDEVTIATQNKLEILQEGRDAELALEEEYRQDQQDSLDALQARFDADLISRETYEAQKAAIEDATRENLKASEEAYAAEKLEIEKNARDKKNEIGKNAFDAEKATKIAGVWIDAASAIMGFWAAMAGLGPPGWIIAGIMSAAAVVTAGVQTALISEQQFVPSKEAGGMAGGATRVNEAGGEVIQLPDQSLVIPHDISRQIAASAGGPSTIIHVSFAGAQIADSMDLDRVTNHVIRKIGKQMRLAV
ncbi:hypothetical protein ES705_26728 [subsurface metagenome]